MMVKVILLLTFFMSNSNSWESYVQNFLNDQINQEVSTETIWATGTLYYSSPVEHRELIIDELESQEIRDALTTQADLKEFVYELAIQKEDELLLLSYLLLEENIDNRTEGYTKFYDTAQSKQFRSLNQLVRDGKQVGNEAFINSTIGFQHFLISFHVSNINVTSEKFFDSVKTLWENSSNRSFENRIKRSYQTATILKAYYETDEYHSINSMYDQFHHLQHLPHSRIKLNLLWGAEFALYSLGHIDKSLETQRKFTIPISKHFKINSTLNSILASHGGYLYQIGKYQEAKEIFLSILNEAEELPTSFQASLFNNLSLVYFKTGENTNYINTQLKALEIAKSIGNIDYETRIYRNLHIVYSRNQNWALASDYIDKAIELASEAGKIDNQITIYTAKASFEFNYLGNLSNALRNIEIADSLLSDSSSYRLKNIVDIEKAKISNSTENFDESRRLFERVKSRSAGESDILTFLEAIIQIAQIDIKTNDYNEARQLMREFRAHDISNLDFPKLILSQTIQADIESYFGNTSEAERLYSEAADLVFERSRNTSEAESGYWTVEEEYLYLFEKYADYLLQNKQYADALILFDRIKTINDATLTDNPLVRSSRLSEETLTAIKNLTQQMDRIRRQILVASDSDRLSLQNRLSKLSAERQMLSSPEETSIDQPLNLQTVQRQLGFSESLVHMTEIKDQLYVSVIDQSNLKIKKIHLDESNRALFESAIESILVGETDLEKFYRIGQLIDIDSIINQSNSIIVMADGYFHQLPFGIIPINRPESSNSFGSAKYLIEKAEVRTLNSLNDLTERQQRINHQYGFSGFGVNDFQNDATSRNLVSLPKAPQEIINISKELNRLDQNKTFINENATVQKFRNNAGNSSILHMATHSEVSESDPLFSTLHFYADETEKSNQVLSGRLFAYELFELNLQNDLIMLNSCESGGDRSLQGSGVMGISRALRYAGANSLVLNSWSVNDHYAAEFAEEFYKHLNNGETKSKALQLTKIQFIKHKNANPHFWGPYILNGDNRPVVTNKNWFAGSLLLAMLFLTGLVVTGRRKQFTVA
ncbi:CHAT domain-containing tetratricopeptide repeat protein [Rhodohalobacter sp.]|uniref:CHAT domain-containing protein n=1 Tax=Rhodohalobacter sp. TaxID=1974210 RepID=UPI002ACE1593|nr:CHAT domain-containing tetratricopeptide repeat protein [Rhodohalobacter sp.]MDZ7755622.1 CHAT domain-containing tetratricopeptide repeat protein [Rhodohalobacter sp.]